MTGIETLVAVSLIVLIVTGFALLIAIPFLVPWLPALCASIVILAGLAWLASLE